MILSDNLTQLTFVEHYNQQWQNKYFSSVYGTVSKIEHMQKQRKKLQISKEILNNIFSIHDENESEINNNKISRNNPSIWKLNNTFLNNLRSKKKSQRKLKIFLH